MFWIAVVILRRKKIMLGFFVGKTLLVKQQEKPTAFFDFCDTLFCKMKSQNLKGVVRRNEKWYLYKSKLFLFPKFGSIHSARSWLVILSIPRKTIQFHLLLVLASTFQIVTSLRSFSEIQESSLSSRDLLNLSTWSYWTRRCFPHLWASSKIGWFH